MPVPNVIDNGGIGGGGGGGSQGFQGPYGFQGYQGPIAPSGLQGNQGPQGAQGWQGNQGLWGIQGPQGFQGIDGTQGYQGLIGPEPGTLFEGSGVTTDAFVTIFTHGRPTGLYGTGTVKNNSGSFQLTVNETGTDAYGTTDSRPTIVNPGNSLILDCQGNIGNARPPYYTYLVQVKSTAAGNSAPYDCKFSSNDLGSYGAQGVQGNQGIQGLQGTNPGPTGPQGPDGPTVITWAFPGSLSTDQNTNIPQWKEKSGRTFTKFDTQLVTAPTGSSVVVDFKKNGATVATVTVTAGNTFAETSATVALAVDDLMWPEVSAVGSSTPGTTAMFRARQV